MGRYIRARAGGEGDQQLPVAGAARKSFGGAVPRRTSALANVLNQAQLGLSAFHLGFTSLDAMISKVALGSSGATLRQGAAGEFGGAAKGRRKAAAVQATHRSRTTCGNKVCASGMEPGSQRRPEFKQLVDAMKAAGGRARQDGFYRTDHYARMMDAFRQGNYVGGALRSAVRGNRAVAADHGVVVPRQKLGVFADLARLEMAKLARRDARQVRAAMAKAWDSVDNRMGQLVYDNLFWNKTVKDLAWRRSARSAGTSARWRELGGAVVDPITQARMARGEKPELTHRMAYAIALPAVVGTLGAMTQYLRPGSGRTSEGLLLPADRRGRRQGRADAREPAELHEGRVRVLSSNPGQTMAHKLHPRSAHRDMLQNEDYYGTKIRNEDDPRMKQAMDLAEVHRQAVRPVQHPRPTAGQRTAAPARQEDSAVHRHHARAQRISQNPSQAAALLDAAEKAGTIRKDEKRDVAKRAMRSPLAYHVGLSNVTAEDAMKVWDAANEKERTELYPIVFSKVNNSKSLDASKVGEFLRRLNAQKPAAAGQAKVIPYRAAHAPAH
jgi:hypothetical protein